MNEYFIFPRKVNGQFLIPIGLFDKSHLDYHVDKNAKHPSLSEMTQKAIEVLQKTKQGSAEGFFLFVEGGKIDIAHHDNLVRNFALT